MGKVTQFLAAGAAVLYAAAPPAAAQSDAGRRDVLNARPGTCSTSVTQSPGFKLFEQMNPGLINLTARERQEAYAISGILAVADEIDAQQEAVSTLLSSFGPDAARTYEPPLPPPPPPPPPGTRSQLPSTGPIPDRVVVTATRHPGSTARRLSGQLRDFAFDAWVIGDGFGPTSEGAYPDQIDRRELAFDEGLLSPNTDLLTGVVSAVIAAVSDGTDTQDAQLSAVLRGQEALQRAGRGNGPLAAYLSAMEASALYKQGEVARAVAPAQRYFAIMDAQQDDIPHQWRVRRDMAALLSVNYTELREAPLLLRLLGDVEQARLNLLQSRARSEAERARNIDRAYGGSITLFDRFFPGGGAFVAEQDRFQMDGILSRLDAPYFRSILNGISLIEVIHAETRSVGQFKRLRPRTMGERLRWMGECSDAAGLLTLAGDLANARHAAYSGLSVIDRDLVDEVLDRFEDQIALDFADSDEDYDRYAQRVDRFQAQLETFADTYLVADAELPRVTAFASLGPLANREVLAAGVGDLSLLIDRRRFERAVDIGLNSWEGRDYLEDTGLSRRTVERDARASYATVAAMLELASDILFDEVDDQLGTADNLSDELDDWWPILRERCADYFHADECVTPISGDVTFIDLAEASVDVLIDNHRAIAAYRTRDRRDITRTAADALNSGRRLAALLNVEQQWETVLRDAGASDRGLVDAAGVLVQGGFGLFAARGDVHPDDQEMIGLFLTRDETELGRLLANFDNEQRSQFVLMRLMKDVLTDIVVGMDVETEQGRAATVERYITLVNEFQRLMPDNWRDEIYIDEYFLEDLEYNLGSIDPMARRALGMYSGLLANHTYRVVHLLDEEGRAAERDFLLDTLQTAVEILPTQERDVEYVASVVEWLQPLLNISVNLSIEHNRPDLGLGAARFSSLAHAAINRDAADGVGTESFRRTRPVYATELWLLYAAHIDAPLGSADLDRVVEMLDAANQSKAGNDLAQVLRLRDAPASVREAYFEFAALDYRADAALGLDRFIAGNRATETPEDLEKRELRRIAGGGNPVSLRQSADAAWANWQAAMLDAGVEPYAPPRIADLRAALRGDEVLITGFVYNSKLVLMSLTQSGELKLTDSEAFTGRPIEYATLSQAVSAYSNGLTASPGGGSPKFDRASAEKLYAWLFGFADEDISAKARLVWVPPRNLDTFPIAALVRTDFDSAEPRYLGLEKEIMVAPSLSGFVETRRRSAASTSPAGMGRVLAVGDVDYRYGRSTLAPLPAAAQSLDAITRQFGPKATVLRRNEATPTSLGRFARQQFDAIIFHAHGVGTELQDECRSPALQALALSEPARSEACHEALLTPDKVLDIALKARSVVLAACSTAAAQTIDNDPLDGLVSAFLIGGADSVVTAHLPVVDAAASQFGEAMLAGLLNDGVGPSAAAQSAMLQVAATPGQEAPVFWAQFEVVGEGAAR